MSAPVMIPSSNLDQLFAGERKAARRSLAGAEGAQRVDEQHLAAMFATAAGAGLAEVALDGQFLRVNDVLCQITGRSREELLKTGMLALRHPDDWVRSLTTVGRLIETGRPVALDERLVRPDGTIVASSSMLTRLDDEDGTPRGFLALTLRRETEEQLRVSEERLRGAIEIETVGILFFDLDGPITGANDAFLRMSGFTREDLEQGLLHWHDLTPPDWIVRSLQAREQLKSTGRMTPYEKECVRKDGSRWWALVAAARVSENDGVKYLIDITERKTTDEALRRSQVDLELRVQERTAELDAVNGALRDEIIERQRAEAGRQELLRQIVSAQEEERRRISRELHDEVGQHVTALQLGLKSLTDQPNLQEEAGTLQKLRVIAERLGREVHDMALKLRPTALDDLGLLRTLTNHVEEWSARTGVEIAFHSSGCTGERLPSHIETTIYRIAQEALTNVMKHARASGVSLIIERRPDQVVVIIEDNGRGFDLEPRETKSGPARLGLLGMQERAALVDGELKIESAPNRGTTLFVRIPLSREKQNAHGETQHSARG